MKTPSPPVFHLEEKPGSDVLVVAFTGVAGKFNAVLPFDFFQMTGTLSYHRILVREPWHYCYLRGIDQTGLDGLRDRLQQEIKRLAPRRVVFMGVSSGGFAALLLGHLLGVDYVHAFSPYTYLDLPNVLRDGSYHTKLLRWTLSVLRMNLLPASLRRYLDLRPRLLEDTGRTRFYVHACACSTDRMRAAHLEDCPRTKVFLYPCRTHNVTWGMLKNKFLFELLREENLDQMEEIYARFYHDFDPDEEAAGLVAGKVGT